MRYVWYGVWLAGVMVLSVIPTVAQGDDVSSVVNRRSDLSTFTIFLNAADSEIQDIVGSGAAVTLFAPTNTAFTNLASKLETPLPELLRNPAVVNALVRYHLIDGRLSAAELRQRSGQLIPTELPGAFVGVQRLDNGDLSLNNVVELAETNIRAGRGYVHVVNDVLLNRIIADELANSNAQDLITPNPGVRTRTPAMTPSPTATRVNSQAANLRVAHLSADAPAVDVFINDDRRIDDLAFGEVGNYITLAPQTYQFAVVPTGDTSDAAVVGPATITLSQGTFVTVAVIGSLAEETLQGDVITEDYRPVDAEQARLVVYHAMPDAPAVNVRVGEDVVAEGLAYGDSVTVDVATGRERVRFVVPPDADETSDEPQSLLWLPSRYLRTGSFQFVSLTGTQDDPAYVFEVVREQQVVQLQGAQVASRETMTPTPTQQVIDRLRGQEEFNILVAAIEAAEPDILDRLSDDTGDPVTLLAPTDQAFANLLASAGITRRQMLNDTELLTEILRYHLVEGAFTAADFRAANGTSIGTGLDSEAFFVSVNSAGDVVLNGVVRFERSDIQASNGIIHVIDEVLLPEPALDLLGL